MISFLTSLVRSLAPPPPRAQKIERYVKPAPASGRDIAFALVSGGVTGFERY